MKATKLFFASVLVTGFLSATGCCNPGNIDVSPDCPAGRQQSAMLNIVGELDDIRPFDSAKDIQVRGNRVSVDPCVEDDAQAAFSIRLQGDRTDMQTVAKLAPGAWTINVTALSGGDHPAINESIVLLAGGSSALVVKATSSGGMVLE